MVHEWDQPICPRGITAPATVHGFFHTDSADMVTARNPKIN